VDTVFKLVLSQLSFDGCNRDLRGFKNPADLKSLLDKTKMTDY